MNAILIINEGDAYFYKTANFRIPQGVDLFCLNQFMLLGFY
jgi:hypothetical protein